ncbi:MAG: hypothetical protein WCK97_08790 [Actinomycetes bacterium]
MRRLGVAALITFAIGCALVIQRPGWAQTSNFLLTRALANGTSQIDAYQWQTGDKSWINGHFYSVKAPGMPGLLVVPYLVLHAIDFESVARSTASINQRLAPFQHVTAAQIAAGAAVPRSPQVARQIREERLMIWALGLFGCVLPALILLFLVRSDAERLVEGTGTATAVVLGLGTMVLPFATQLFGHVMAAMLLYLGFHLLMRERRGPPNPRLVLLAGLIVGLAVVVEYPMAFGGAVLGLYAMLRGGETSARVLAALRRAALFAVGVVVGLIPLAIYNQLSFGSITQMSYSAAVAVEGLSGHAVLGLNGSGFFGIGAPNAVSFVDILLSPRGLLSITPVCLLAVIGLVWMRRAGHRAEALTIAGIVAIYLIYVSGYWLPFGGDSPGPRFLVAILPFIALGLPYAWKRIPAATVVLGAASATIMVAASLVGPLTKPNGLGVWWSRIQGGPKITTVFTLLGAPSGLASTLPVYLVFVAVAVLAAGATYLPRLGVGRDLPVAAAALLGWLVLALVVSPAIGERKILPGNAAVALPHKLVAFAAVVGLIALAALLLRQRLVSAGRQPDPAAP